MPDLGIIVIIYSEKTSQEITTIPLMEPCVSQHLQPGTRSVFCKISRQDSFRCNRMSHSSPLDYKGQP